MSMYQFIVINFGAFLTAVGGVFLKKLSGQLDYSWGLKGLFFYSITSLNFWLGGFCFVFPIFLWVYLLKTMELTKLQPLLAIVYLYTILLSFLFLAETPSLGRLVGIALVIAGVVMVGRS